MSETRDRNYIVQSLVHAAEVLVAFHTDGEILRLRDVVARTGMSKGLCFRMLYTMHRCGFLDKVGENQYRAVARFRRKKKYRIGYAGEGHGSSFPQEVSSGLVNAAAEAEVELVSVDNRYNAKTALRCADQLIREEVDLVIEYQADEGAAPAIAQKFMEANIPMIAIDIPHPGATYFGANNYDAGLIGGRYLGRWATRHWDGEAEEIVMIEILRSGSLPQARIRGMLAGIHETLQRTERARIVHLDGDGQFRATLECIRKHLRISKAKRILVGAANDSSALGALRAFDEAGRAGDCAVVGHNAEPDGRAELREKRTRLIGSVAYFPEKYGGGLIRLALDILTGKATPPAVFIKHHLITPDTVDHYYPNDTLMATVSPATKEIHG